MTTEQLYDMMGQGNLGFACVFKKEDNGKHTDFLFPMTPENIANFIGQNAFTADKIIMTDFCDRLICESIYGGFLMNCPDQNLCREIVPHLAAIQQGDKEPEQFPVATREEMQEVCTEPVWQLRTRCRYRSPVVRKGTRRISCGRKQRALEVHTVPHR